MNTPLTSGPFSHSTQTVDKVMCHVLLALLPATLFNLWLFGLPSIPLFVITVASAIGLEAAYLALTGKDVREGVCDGSAALTGWLLAMSLPPWAPLWLGVSSQSTRRRSWAGFRQVREKHDEYATRRPLPADRQGRPVGQQWRARHAAGHVPLDGNDHQRHQRAGHGAGHGRGGGRFQPAGGGVPPPGSRRRSAFRYSSSSSPPW